MSGRNDETAPGSSAVPDVGELDRKRARVAAAVLCRPEAVLFSYGPGFKIEAITIDGAVRPFTPWQLGELKKLGVCRTPIGWVFDESIPLPTAREASALPVDPSLVASAPNPHDEIRRASFFVPEKCSCGANVAHWIDDTSPAAACNGCSAVTQQNVLAVLTSLLDGPGGLLAWVAQQGTASLGLCRLAEVVVRLRAECGRLGEGAAYYESQAGPNSVEPSIQEQEAFSKVRARLGNISAQPGPDEVRGALRALYEWAGRPDTTKGGG